MTTKEDETAFCVCKLTGCGDASDLHVYETDLILRQNPTTKAYNVRCTKQWIQFVHFKKKFGAEETLRIRRPINGGTYSRVVVLKVFDTRKEAEEYVAGVRIGGRGARKKIPKSQIHTPDEVPSVKKVVKNREAIATELKEARAAKKAAHAAVSCARESVANEILTFLGDGHDNESTRHSEITTCQNNDAISEDSRDTVSTSETETSDYTKLSVNDSGKKAILAALRKKIPNVKEDKDTINSSNDVRKNDQSRNNLMQISEDHDNKENQTDNRAVNNNVRVVKTTPRDMHEEPRICNLQEDMKSDKENSSSDNSRHDQSGNKLMQISEKSDFIEENQTDNRDVSENVRVVKTTPRDMHEEPRICNLQEDMKSDKENSSSDNSRHDQSGNKGKSDFIEENQTDNRDVNENVRVLKTTQRDMHEEPRICNLQEDIESDKENSSNNNNRHDQSRNKLMQISEKSDFIEENQTDNRDVNDNVRVLKTTSRNMREEPRICNLQEDKESDKENSSNNNSRHEQSRNKSMQIAEKSDFIEENQPDNRDVNENVRLAKTTSRDTYDEPRICNLQENIKSDKENSSSDNSRHDQSRNKLMEISEESDFIEDNRPDNRDDDENILVVKTTSRNMHDEPRICNLRGCPSAEISEDSCDTVSTSEIEACDYDKLSDNQSGEKTSLRKRIPNRNSMEKNISSHEESSNEFVQISEGRHSDEEDQSHNHGVKENALAPNASTCDIHEKPQISNLQAFDFLVPSAMTSRSSLTFSETADDPLENSLRSASPYSITSKKEFDIGAHDSLITESSTTTMTGPDYAPRSNDSQFNSVRDTHDYTSSFPACLDTTETRTNAVIIVANKNLTGDNRVNVEKMKVGQSTGNTQRDANKVPTKCTTPSPLTKYNETPRRATVPPMRNLCSDAFPRNESSIYKSIVDDGTIQNSSDCDRCVPVVRDPNTTDPTIIESSWKGQKSTSKTAVSIAVKAASTERQDNDYSVDVVDNDYSVDDVDNNVQDDDVDDTVTDDDENNEQKNKLKRKSTKSKIKGDAKKEDNEKDQAVVIQKTLQPMLTKMKRQIIAAIRTTSLKPRYGEKNYGDDVEDTSADEVPCQLPTQPDDDGKITVVDDIRVEFDAAWRALNASETHKRVNALIEGIWPLEERLNLALSNVHNTNYRLITDKELEDMIKSCLAMDKIHQLDVRGKKNLTSKIRPWISMKLKADRHRHSDKFKTKQQEKRKKDIAKKYIVKRKRVNVDDQNLSDREEHGKRPVKRVRQNDGCSDGDTSNDHNTSSITIDADFISTFLSCLGQPLQTDNIQNHGHFKNLMSRKEIQELTGLTEAQLAAILTADAHVILREKCCVVDIEYENMVLRHMCANAEMHKSSADEILYQHTSILINEDIPEEVIHYVFHKYAEKTGKVSVTSKQSFYRWQKEKICSSVMYCELLDTPKWDKVRDLVAQCEAVPYCNISDDVCATLICHHCEIFETNGHCQLTRIQQLSELDGRQIIKENLTRLGESLLNGE